MTKKITEKLRQLVIRNYLESEYQTDSIWLYYGISDGMKRIKDDMKEVSSDKLSVFCLVDMYGDVEEEMMKSIACAVKNKMLKFDKMEVLRNVLRLQDVPDNAVLLMLIMPKNLLYDGEVRFALQRFNELKADIMSCDTETRYKIFNRLANDLTYDEKMVMFGLDDIIRDAKFNSFTLMFGRRDISYEDSERMKNNLEHTDVRIVKINDMIQYDLRSRYVGELLESMEKC